MLSVEEIGVLKNLINHCLRIEEKISGISKEEFDNSLDIKEIVCFNIFQIGELARSLSESFINTYKKVPWKKIMGMRNRIGHGYGTIDMNKVWGTAIQDIKPLREYCEVILKEASHES